ncbi:MAG: hypothetical protein JKY10_05230 [Cohaesibacteraceae bacterium]|nr:hypothetical protein [Cohaesibacteraceae bacterium]
MKIVPAEAVVAVITRAAAAKANFFIVISLVCSVGGLSCVDHPFDELEIGMAEQTFKSQVSNTVVMILHGKRA